MSDCYHVQPSAGQFMCVCIHRRVEQEILIDALLAEVVRLRTKLTKGTITYPLEKNERS